MGMPPKYCWSCCPFPQVVFHVEHSCETSCPIPIDLGLATLGAEGLRFEETYSGPVVGCSLISSTVLFSGRDSAHTSAVATVSGDIIFLRGASGHSAFQMSVSVAPGMSAITRIPFGRSSSRKVSVNPRAPYLEASYADKPGKTRVAASDRLLTIVPPRRISGMIWWVTRNVPVRLVS